ncbi:MAG: tetratricopeptide repeat protein [Lachnospiraceae bacterium]|nr:tetratricopeptide repeat protein [Lachnospiraceae bacterium]
MFRIILQNIINFIKIIATAITVFMLIYLIFFQNPRDYHSIGKYTSLLLTFIIYHMKTRKKPVLYHKEAYEKAFKILLEGTFAEDKDSYQKLIKCADYMVYKKYIDAHMLLNSLESKCVRSKDYVAVYAFHGVCYDNEKKYTDAIAAYRKALEYDMSVSFIWNNLGLCYLHTDDIKEAFDALSNAIMYDAYNMQAYANMANYFLTYGQPQAALHYVQKALELAPNNKDILGWAALTYKKLGDEYNASLYSDLYIKNGGSKSSIKLMNKLHTKSSQ